MPILDLFDFDALIIAPKLRMIEWVNQIFPDQPIDEHDPLGHDHSSIYLIPEFDHAGDAMEWLKDNFEDIFFEELVGWCTDESLFPELTWETFNEFCIISYQSMVRVLGDEDEDEDKDEDEDEDEDEME